MTNDKAQVDVKHDTDSEPDTAPQEMAGPLSALRQEIDRMFDDFDFGRWGRSGRRFGKALQRAGWPGTPLSDLTENEDAFHLTMELPGLDPEDIEIKITDSMISLSGEKTEEHKEEKKDYHLSERHFGAFKRSFSLPRGVDIDNVSASLSQGVLELTLPKTAEARKNERKIEVKAA